MRGMGKLSVEPLQNISLFFVGCREEEQRLWSTLDELWYRIVHH